MSEKVYKFPSIGALRNAIQEVQYRATFAGFDEAGETVFDSEAELPTIRYQGTVKIHGTNAGIIYVLNPETSQYEVNFQSKSNVITPLNDNAGFATHGSTIDTDALLSTVLTLGYTEYPEVIRIYGEWCGAGIQKGVGVNTLPKMLVVVAVKVGDTWLRGEQLKGVKRPEDKIYNILDYPTYFMDVDFSNPKLAADTIVGLVDEVEAECPVAKAFGVEAMTDNVAYEENGKIWFEIDSKIIEDLKVELTPQFKKIREISPIGVNYIKFNLV